MRVLEGHYIRASKPGHIRAVSLCERSDRETPFPSDPSSATSPCSLRERVATPTNERRKSNLTLFRILASTSPPFTAIRDQQPSTGRTASGTFSGKCRIRPVSGPASSGHCGYGDDPHDGTPRLRKHRRTSARGSRTPLSLCAVKVDRLRRNRGVLTSKRGEDPCDRLGEAAKLGALFVGVVGVDLGYGQSREFRALDEGP
jgi:hypothetical protein